MPTALAELPENAKLFIANSMPIRDMDNYLSLQRRRLLNRGANGMMAQSLLHLGWPCLVSQRLF